MNTILLSQELEKYVVSLRRELHQHPELSMQEEWTCGRICRELTALGIPYEIAGEKILLAVLSAALVRRSPFGQISTRSQFWKRQTSHGKAPGKM